MWSEDGAGLGVETDDLAASQIAYGLVELGTQFIYHGDLALEQGQRHRCDRVGINACGIFFFLTSEHRRKVKKNLLNLQSLYAII